VCQHIGSSANSSVPFIRNLTNSGNENLNMLSLFCPRPGWYLYQM
jgi:hypothetical protein